MCRKSNELRKRHTLNVVGALANYVEQGGGYRFDSCVTDDEGLAIVFHVNDDELFNRILMARMRRFQVGSSLFLS